MVNTMCEKWRLIETAPRDGRTVDLWCGEYEERLTNYRRVKLSKTNVFYEPVYGGRACVRTATHWMEPPGPPKGGK